MHQRFFTDGTNGPFARRILGTGAALTVLFAVMAPESSAPLALAPRLLYWALHIGLGLAAVGLAATFLMRRLRGFRDWRFVVLSGLAGVVLFAPVAYGLESLFQVTAGAPDDDWADRFARTSLLAAIAVEAYEMAPSFLAAWAVINFGPIDEALQNMRSAAVPAPEPAPILPAPPANAFLDR
ncbi:MAG: hypothetical protein AAFU65_09805, partial [Pseudomonadota bacterium]